MADPRREPDDLSAARADELAAAAARIGHRFADLNHLKRAFCHASMGHATKANYERLEFLGDAILSFLVAEQLYCHQPEIPVGQLTELRSRLVAREPLAEVAKTLGLGNLLEGGRGLREQDRSSPRILADLVEAVLAAVYLDGGLGAASAFVERWILTSLPAARNLPAPARDAKSRILHFAQTRGLGQPTYRVLVESGPPHDRTFDVGCVIGQRIVARGVGKSRQLAEKAAATAALRELNGAGDDPRAEDPPA